MSFAYDTCLTEDAQEFGYRLKDGLAVAFCPKSYGKGPNTSRQGRTRAEKILRKDDIAKDVKTVLGGGQIALDASREWLLILAC